MKMLDCIKMLLKFHGIPERRLCKWRGCKPQTVNKLLNGKDIKCCAAVDVLDFLGYEVIVRERRPGHNRVDEILIDMGDESITPERVAMMMREAEKKKAKEEYYKERDKELLQYPRGMRVCDLREFFGKKDEWVHKYFDGYFFDRRVQLKDVSKIMRKYNL